MIQNGLKPIALDLRDYSAARTFGSVAPHTFAENYSVDTGKTMADQNADGLFQGCTGYTQTDNLVDEMGSILKASYTYFKTCMMEGHGYNQGCDIRTSLKSTQVYGVQELAETTDQEAEKHRGGKYFNVYNDGGLDWFDSVRSAVFINQKGASCGSPWFPIWEQVGSDGIILMPPLNQIQSPDSLPWHNYSCKGWKTINGVPYLMIKSWQGVNYGAKGWCYMSREVANKVFEIRGSGIFMQAHANTEDIQTIKVSILEQAITFLLMIIGLKRLN